MTNKVDPETFKFSMSHVVEDECSEDSNRSHSFSPKKGKKNLNQNNRDSFRQSYKNQQIVGDDLMEREDSNSDDYDQQNHNQSFNRNTVKKFL